MPAVIRWPGKLPAGEVRDQLAVAVDWFPTLVDLCQLEPLPHSIDGKSLQPLLEDAQTPTAHDVFHWQSGKGMNGEPQWAVRQGPWKLLGNPRDTSERGVLGPTDRRFLVNLETDPGEANNLAAEHPDIVSRLEKLHQQWAEAP